MSHFNNYNPAPKKRKVWPWVVGVLAFLLLAFVGCTAMTVSAVDDVVSKPSVNAPAFESEDQGPVDPLVTDGTYLVGSEIQPGTYRVVPAENLFGEMGYWARCADLACEVDMDGLDSTGLITNEIVQGPGFLVVEQTDVAVELRGLVLTPQ